MRPAPSRRPLWAVALLLAAAAPSLAEAPKPKHKDSRDSFKPAAAKFTAEITPAEARPGDTVTYKVTAKIDAPWHIYASLKTPPKGGPVYTSFDTFSLDGLKEAGDWKPDAPPIKHAEAAFPDIPALEYHEDEVTWSLPLKVPASAEPGKKSVRSQVHFMICDPKSCTPPVYHTLPAATVTIKPGAGASAIKPGALYLAALTVGATTAPPAATPTPTPGGVQGEIDKGLIPFLLFSAAGGLFALLMPCVWPMVPVTVNFFVKQGQAKGGAGTTRLAVTYCLAIIGIFIAVGMLFSIVLGAASLNRLANNPWLNVAVAGTFLAFGLSLLGLFEIGLPSSFLNASAQGEGRGGLVGVIFMALTLTITSFTCTFPVVGGLLVLAAKGSYLYPILGLATFATVLALPFFVLALAPGLLSKLPRSGDWMNSVKMVGGLVEIGAAFKFLNTAEIGFGSTPANAWLDSGVLLAVWVVLSAVCGLYLLGIFKTDHDYGDSKVGPGRILFGSLFLTVALYLAPALFGVPPKSKVYERLVVGLLPADSVDLDSGRQIALQVKEELAGELGSLIAAAPPAAGSGAVEPKAAREERGEVKATSKVPEVAVTQEKRVHGVRWGMSYEAALDEAKKTNRPVLIDFTGVNCANCRLMERSVMPKPEVVAELSKFVPVQLYTDFVDIETLTNDQREVLAEANLEREQTLVNQTTSPLYVVVSPEGKVLESVGGFNEVPTFVKFLKSGLDKHKAGTGTVASLGN